MFNKNLHTNQYEDDTAKKFHIDSLHFLSYENAKRTAYDCE